MESEEIVIMLEEYAGYDMMNVINLDLMYIYLTENL